MSRHCLKTDQRCHDPKCGDHWCELQHPPSEKSWEQLMKKLEERPWQERLFPQPIINVYNNTENIFLTPEEHHHRKHQRVEQVLFFIFNNNKYITMALSIATNQSAPIILGLIDADTRLPITATFAGETETSDNPAVATTDPTLGLVAVKTNTAGGSGNLTSVATWTYTDKNTNQLVTVQKTTVTPFIVTPVITAENVEMTVTLGPPVTQP